jgi:hypothetical protein
MAVAAAALVAANEVMAEVMDVRYYYFSFL